MHHSIPSSESSMSFQSAIKDQTFAYLQMEQLTGHHRTSNMCLCELDECKFITDPFFSSIFARHHSSASQSQPAFTSKRLNENNFTSSAIWVIKQTRIYVQHTHYFIYNISPINMVMDSEKTQLWLPFSPLCIITTDNSSLIMWGMSLVK